MAVSIRDIAMTLQAELVEDEQKAAVLQTQLAEINQRIAANRAWLGTRGFRLSPEVKSNGKDTHTEELPQTESKTLAVASESTHTITETAAQILTELVKTVSMQ